MLNLIHPLKYGVPQGSILGPVLFTIYVNDLLSVPTFCKSACYVDDSKLYLSFPSSYMSTAIHNLNSDLEFYDDAAFNFAGVRKPMGCGNMASIDFLTNQTTKLNN